MALNTTTGTGTQTATGTPQNVGGPSTNAAPSGNVQPGTATNLLNSSSGISLSGSALTTVDLAGTSATTTTQATTEPPTQPHHVNAAALGLFIALAVVAVLVFVSMTRSAKNTTH
ncbi:MAG: hypothetical protein U0524_02670 [Candidatus Saccharimonadales bacterium]